MSEKNFVGFGVSLRPELARGLRLLAAMEDKSRSELVRELIEVGLVVRERQGVTLPKTTQEGQE